eukprot:GHVT01068586.1.p1 GENE.GHVT01068586.1~~GHVT01068586.1.p1  ORF type:complete len:126 (-),score=16.37 GHVT01068586.1:170-547(-)
MLHVQQVYAQLVNFLCCETTYSPQSSGASRLTASAAAPRLFPSPLLLCAVGFDQVKARGAFLICITDEPSMVAGLADATLCIPSLGPLTALLAAIPLQLLAYHIGIAKGVDPDKPRGLAKTVTVL